jgi:hypothetical protein
MLFRSLEKVDDDALFFLPDPIPRAHDCASLERHSSAVSHSSLAER